MLRLNDAIVKFDNKMVCIVSVCDALTGSQFCGGSYFARKKKHIFLGCLYLWVVINMPKQRTRNYSNRNREEKLANP